MTSEQIRESIPTALDDCMGISETVAEYEEEENIDIDLDGGLSAVNEQDQHENK
jgi:hypothetical protein